jgi:transcriptional regulator with GAF, ATPase, and Fis domain
MNLLMSYEWPGNIRELKNSLERAVTLANPDSELTPALFVFLVDNRGVPGGRTLAEDLEDVERQRIVRTLEENGWVKAAAARVLKVTRTTLTSRMERLGIPLRRPRSRPQ